MKRQLLNTIIFILVFLPLHFFAQPARPVQQDITGLWKGSLYNDTTKKILPYQIAISEEKGKLTGYSYTLFDIDGKQELGVKRIKIKRKDDLVIIEDITLISNNYSAPAPRKVRQLSVVNLLMTDTAMLLTGNWSTNQTKEYSPLTGSLQLQRAIDYRPLVLFKKLVELKLDKDLSFVQPIEAPAPVIAINEKPANPVKSTIPVTPVPAVIDNPKEIAAPLPGEKTGAAVLVKVPGKEEDKPAGQPFVKMPPVDKTKAITSPVVATGIPALIPKDSGAVKIKPVDELVKVPVNKPPSVTGPVTQQKKEVVVANDTKKENNQPAILKPAAKNLPPENKQKAIAANEKQPAQKINLPAPKIVNKPVDEKNPGILTAPLVNSSITPAANPLYEPIRPETIAPKVLPDRAGGQKGIPVAMAAAEVLERKMNNTQAVFFDSDSLVLTLYDNGDVDGDTVSVLMNGQIIFARQGLSTKANSKTIYMEKGSMDSLSMVMYAENLGSIPPNTGLMVIMDGEKRYEVRFSADLKTNAAILLRRRIK
ncbi:MAG: hypothetical protein H7Z13_20050 [Ferruginibacter sp.]|nr:hypothetical protein [Ferruginibacter sp.]